MVPGFLRAAGDAKFTMLASMLTMWVVRVLLAYVLGKYMGYGVIGVWFAHAIVDWSVRRHLLPALPQRQVGDDGDQDVMIF